MEYRDRRILSARTLYPRSTNVALAGVNVEGSLLSLVRDRSFCLDAGRDNNGDKARSPCGCNNPLEAQSKSPILCFLAMINAY